MKKILMATIICGLILTISGCKKNKEGEQDNQNINFDVFEKMDNNLYTEAQNSSATFLLLLDDGTINSKLLKEATEELAHKYKYTIYTYDLQEEYNRIAEERKDEIQTEKDDFFNTFCEKQILTTEELTMYEDTSSLERDEAGNYIALKCSYEIANRKNPEISIMEEEPFYECGVCKSIKSSILNRFGVNEPANLLFRHNGYLMGSTGQYLPEEYEYFSKENQELHKVENEKALEKWFSEVVANMTK